MSIRFLPFQSQETESPAVPSPTELTNTSLRFLNRLRDVMAASARLVTAGRRIEASRAKSWGVPSLFFFDRKAQSESATRQPAEPKFPESLLPELSRRMPMEVEAWHRLPALLDNALTLLPASLDVRRAARAVTGLAEAAKAVAPVLKSACELTELLAVPDDQVVLAIHPEARVGVRVLIRGVADVNQLHTLLADELIGSRLVPGQRPDPRIVSAYRDADPDPDADVMTARFQLFRPCALTVDGTMPRGFGGSDHWVWGEESPTTFPLERGERVVVLSDAIVPATWEVRRKFPRLSAEMHPVEVLSRTNVDRWLATRCPNWAKPPVSVRLVA